MRCSRSFGTALGICAAYWLIRRRRRASLRKDCLGSTRSIVDARAAGFAALSGLVTPIALRRRPGDLAGAHTRRAHARRGWTRRHRFRAPSASAPLSSSQLAFALVLLTAAGLFGESIRRLTSQPLGFNPGAGGRDHYDIYWNEIWRSGGCACRSSAQWRAAGPGREDFGRLMGRLGREAGNIRDEQVFERLAARCQESSKSLAPTLFLSSRRLSDQRHRARWPSRRPNVTTRCCRP